MKPYGDIQSLDVVALTENLDEHGLRRGHVGTVVEKLDNDFFDYHRTHLFQFFIRERRVIWIRHGIQSDNPVFFLGRWDCVIFRASVYRLVLVS